MSNEAPELLTAGEVGKRFGVTAKQVCRWADLGLLAYQRTLGGHRRFRADEVRELLASTRQERRG